MRLLLQAYLELIYMHMESAGYFFFFPQDFSVGPFDIDI